MRLKIVGAIILLGIVVSLLFICNPLYIRRVDASKDAGINLEDIYSPVTPFVEIRHMKLEDSGYYTVNDNGDVCSRYYFGQIGSRQCFVEISENYLSKHAPKENAEHFQDTWAQDVTLTAKLIPAEDIIRYASAQADVTAGEYPETFEICPMVISEYKNNSIAIVIYYALALLLGIGVLAVSQR